MTRVELYSELLGLADSIDEHINRGNIVTALGDLANRVMDEGIE